MSNGNEAIWNTMKSSTPLSKPPTRSGGDGPFNLNGDNQRPGPLTAGK